MKTTLLDVWKIRAQLEKILGENGPEDFGDLKFNEWENFDADMSEHMQSIKDEMQTLISSTVAFLKNDKSESQTEVLKLSVEAKKLRGSVDVALQELNALRKTELSLEEIIDAHLKMAATEIQLEDSFRVLR